MVIGIRMLLRITRAMMNIFHIFHWNPVEGELCDPRSEEVSQRAVACAAQTSARDFEGGPGSEF